MRKIDLRWTRRTRRDNEEVTHINVRSGVVAVRRILRDSPKLVRRKMDMTSNTKKGKSRFLHC